VKSLMIRVMTLTPPNIFGLPSAPHHSCSSAFSSLVFDESQLPERRVRFGTLSAHDNLRVRGMSSLLTRPAVENVFRDIDSPPTVHVRSIKFCASEREAKPGTLRPRLRSRPRPCLSARLEQLMTTATLN
jgi:hypothetical protein